MAQRPPGRPEIPKDKQEAIKRMEAEGKGVRETARILGISPGTVRNWRKDRGKDEPPGKDDEEVPQPEPEPEPSRDPNKVGWNPEPPPELEPVPSRQPPPPRREGTQGSAADAFVARFKEAKQVLSDARDALNEIEREGLVPPRSNSQPQQQPAQQTQQQAARSSSTISDLRAQITKMEAELEEYAKQHGYRLVRPDFPGNIDEAKKLLEQAGYILQPTTFKREDVERLVVEYRQKWQAEHDVAVDSKLENGRVAAAKEIIGLAIDRIFAFFGFAVQPGAGAGPNISRNRMQEMVDKAKAQQQPPYTPPPQQPKPSVKVNWPEPPPERVVEGEFREVKTKTEAPPEPKPGA